MTNLISGKEALIALANGEEVEYFDTRETFKSSGWTDAKGMQAWLFIQSTDGLYKFRLKPRTITLNGIEVPAPFKPKEGDLYWHISPEYTNGYGESMYNDGNVDTWQQFGAWRTEEQIKQVVAALRQVFGRSDDAVNAARGGK